MPELPEVETIRRGLEKRLQGKRFKKIEIRKKKIVHGNSGQFIKIFQGNSFTDIGRRGKLLIFHLKRGGYLLCHLKMTGQLIYKDGATVIAGGHAWPPVAPPGGGGYGGRSRLTPSNYTHVIFTFTDGSQLFFNDLRQFGYMRLVTEDELQNILSRFGVEPLTPEFTPEVFRALFTGRKTSVKAVLLNQAIIAGLGNIYADEVCFAAKVRPGRRVPALTAAEKERMFEAIPRILQKAIKYGGTTFRDFRDGDGSKGNFTELLQVYGRTGDTCKRCRSARIKKTKVAGRGTYYCPNCQK